MALPKLEAFTGSDGTALSTYNASWVANVGTMSIRSNNVRGDSSGQFNVFFWNGDTFNNDQYAEIVGIQGDNPTYIGVGLRHAGAGVQTFYYYAASTADSYVAKLVAGTETVLATGGSSATNDVLRLEATGTSLQAKKNGSNAFSAITDSAIASGKAGIVSYGFHVNVRGDNWEGGNIGGGGTTYMQSVSGAITPTGALTRRSNKVYAGSATPTGSLTRRVSKILAGGVTPSGALTTIKIALLSLAGSITPTGALARQANKALAGSITPTGAISKQISKLLAGALAPSGTLANVKVALLSLVGAITPTGAIVKRTGKLATGSVTPGGTLLKTPAKTLAGAISSITGAIAKQSQKVISGTVTPTGSLTRRVAKTLAGAITPGATLVKRMAKAFSGSITPVASLAAMITSGLPTLPSASTIFNAAYYGSVIFDVAYWTSVISDKPYWDSD